jgi:hypothetical protein
MEILNVNMIFWRNRFLHLEFKSLIKVKTEIEIVSRDIGDTLKIKFHVNEQISTLSLHRQQTE